MLKKWMGIFFCLLFLTGCGSALGSASIWIDVPLNPISLAEVQPVQIKGHAASEEGIAKVEVWVNGTLIDMIENPPTHNDLAAFETIFTPDGPGEYAIQVVATTPGGQASTPDTAVVIIGEAPVAVEVLPEDPTPTLTPTPTLVPPVDEPSVEYWADPAEIEAGGCTTIYWEVQNVSRVEFGGYDQEFSGSYRDCMCETQTYPLTVTYEDGSVEVFRVTIAVSGVCATVTPVADTTPPAPPVLLKPVDGAELACTSYVMLRWQASTDPSGIAEYRIQVERHSGDNNWTAVSGSVFTGITATEKELYVECGWDYRFRVRALDGAGNLGGWSGWFTFADLLS